MKHTPMKSSKMASSSEEDLSTLVQLRGMAQGNITRIKNILTQTQADQAELPSAQVKVYVKKVESAYNEYHQHHQQIVAILPSNKKEEQNEKFLQFETLHEEVSIMLETLLEAQAAPPAAQQVQPPANQQPLVIQQSLPRAIPTFDGRYENWDRFKIMFRDAVDRTNEAPRIKLYHLEKALVGDAAGIIDVKTIADGNYAHAWELLEERFEDQRRMIDIHIAGLLGVKKLAKEDFGELRSLVESTTSHVENLKFLDQEFTGVSELIVVHLIARALDPTTKKLWESTIKRGEIPNYEDTIQFLKDRVSVLERCRDTDEEAKAQRTSAKPATRKQAFPNANAATAPPSADQRCTICDESHVTYKCSVFNGLSVSDRLAKVKQKNVCYNCLRSGHSVKNCPSKKSCSTCNKRHHTLLHLEGGAISSQPANENSANGVPGSAQPAASAVRQQSAENQPSVTAAHSNNPVNPASQVVLLTALVNVMDHRQRPRVCKALLDCGSQITGQVPSVKINLENWELPQGLRLADPSFHEPSHVDLLIGMDWFYDIMKPGCLKIDDNLPSLHDSKLGWLVGGKLLDCSSNLVLNSCAVRIDPIEELVQKFWEVEGVSSEVVLSSEEEQCESQFASTHRRDDSGRFIVHLPLKDNASQLSVSRTMALRRFFMLESKLQRHPDLKAQYDAFIDEYESLGHCREVQERDDPPGVLKWYLPHHAVLRPSNTTTKCRVVFDASAKVAGLSLNDVLMTGYNVQSDLLSIILRFRRYRYVISADVAKMYRQVAVDPAFTPLQRIFWRRSPQDPLRVLELTTVTFGTASAPFLATRSLLQLARDERETFPLASAVVEKNVYIDDALFGSDDFLQACELRDQLIALLQSGGMHLHKWSSNTSQLLSPIPSEDRDSCASFSESGLNEVIKTLGLMWNPSTDEFLFRSSLSEKASRPTKRQVLSKIAKIYDPLGLISPVVVLAKIVMQKLWISKLNWDDPLDDTLLNEWENFLMSLPTSEQIRIPLHVLSNKAVRYELHGFADASQKAYGACVVTEITSNTSHVWKYVRTDQNPADTVSRGQSARELANNEQWWNGPQILYFVDYSEEQPQSLQDCEIPELRVELAALSVMNYEEFPVLTKFASFRKCQRIVAYMLRFISNARKRQADRVMSRYLTIPELRAASNLIVGAIQHQEFAKEIACVRADEPNHRLNNLKPFLDEDLLRVGGRLGQSQLPFGVKHQLILPSNNPIVHGLINDVHRENHHAGNSMVQYLLRQHFWLINARSTIRKVLRTCVTCFRTNPTTIDQQMGDLPSYRINPAPVFERVGLDFAGPIYVKQSVRKATPVKGYICVFICMVTKAMHLEAVEDLSTDSFLAAFQRFVSRRGYPKEVFSDNGTNFIGARSALQELYRLFKEETTQNKIFEYCQAKQIIWKTIPPNAPHFGGLWEAGVKSVKAVLKRVYQSTSLTLSGLYTLLCQIEAILNSRPLYSQSNDSTEPEALTPGHFIANRPLLAIPEPSVLGIPTNRLSHWQHIQQLREHFWKRWSREYLTELQVRGKWTKQKVNIQPGMVVLLKDDNLPPQCWNLGRVERVHPGIDNLVRVVDVRTKTGTFRRPIHKLAPLPILDDDPNVQTSTLCRGENVQFDSSQTEEASSSGGDSLHHESSAHPTNAERTTMTKQRSNSERATIKSTAKQRPASVLFHPSSRLPHSSEAEAKGAIAREDRMRQRAEPTDATVRQ
ncbi:uncharacterized protein LOC134290657 [Aedes albopictus]|uniref:Endonuclease n=1 Tax=Aedes albopictus TaxID=7160 RepID=A0ABM1XQA0_AEDAL